MISKTMAGFTNVRTTSIINSADITSGTFENSQGAYFSGLTSNIQDQFNSVSGIVYNNYQSDQNSIITLNNNYSLIQTQINNINNGVGGYFTLCCESVMTSAWVNGQYFSWGANSGVGSLNMVTYVANSNLIFVGVTCASAVTGLSTMNILKNGVVVVSLNILSGTRFITGNYNMRYVLGDTLSVRSGSGNSPATGVRVSLIFASNGAIFDSAFVYSYMNTLSGIVQGNTYQQNDLNIYNSNFLNSLSGIFYNTNSLINYNYIQQNNTNLYNSLYLLSISSSINSNYFSQGLQINNLITSGSIDQYSRNYAISISSYVTYIFSNFSDTFNTYKTSITTINNNITSLQNTINKLINSSSSNGIGTITNGLFTGAVGALSALGFASLYSSLLTIQAEIQLINLNLVTLRGYSISLNEKLAIESQKNIYLNQNIFSSNLIVTGGLDVLKETNLLSTVTINKLNVKSSINTYSLTAIEDIKTNFGNLYISGSSKLVGKTTIYDDLNITGNTEASNLNIGNSVNINNNLYTNSLHVKTSILCDADIVTNTLYNKNMIRIDGPAYFNSQVNLNYGLSVVGKTVLNNTTTNYDPYFTVLETKGSAIIRGTLVCNNLVIKGDLIVYGNITYTGKLIYAPNLPNNYNF